MPPSKEKERASGQPRFDAGERRHHYQDRRCQPQDRYKRDQLQHALGQSGAAAEGDSDVLRGSRNRCAGKHERRRRKTHPTMRGLAITPCRPVGPIG
jgi:hypothetical protein